MIVVQLQFVFALQPADKPLAIDMQLDLFGLFLDPLLQALILVLEQKNLPLQLDYAFLLCSELLTANLGHVLHISLLSDMPLVLFVEGVNLKSQLLFFALVSGTHLRQVPLPCLVCQVFSKHMPCGVDIVLDSLFLKLAGIQVLS